MAIEKIDNYTKPAPVNPYIEDFKALALGDVFAVTVAPKTVKAKDGTEKVRSGVAGEKSRVQDAARALGFTAREQERTEVEGGVRIVFKLYEAQESGPRKGK